MANDRDVNISTVLYALDIRERGALVARLVFIAAAGRDELGERVKNHEAHRTTKMLFGLAKGCQDLRHCGGCHQIYGCLSHCDRQPFKA